MRIHRDKNLPGQHSTQLGWGRADRSNKNPHSLEYCQTSVGAVGTELVGTPEQGTNHPGPSSWSSVFLSFY